MCTGPHSASGARPAALWSLAQCALALSKGLGCLQRGASLRALLPRGGTERSSPPRAPGAAPPSEVGLQELPRVSLWVHVEGPLLGRASEEVGE